MLDRAEDLFAKDADELRWINLFGSPDGKTDLFAFRVKVRNTTSKAVRMADWCVYLKVAGRDKAIAPANDLTFYNQWVLGKEVAMNNRKEGALASIQSGYVIRHVAYPVGIAGALLAHRFPSWDAANLMKKEVPPGASVTGFLRFPAEIGVDSISVVFSSLDASPGGTAQGQRACEFRFRREDRSYLWDKSRKRWVAGASDEAGR